jgi:hypothetical protein
VLVRNVPKPQVKRLCELMCDLACLLSFASVSSVDYFGYEYPHGSGNIEWWKTGGVARCFRPTIDIHNATMVKHFISTTWSSYQRQKRSRRLHLPVRYLVQADRELSIELKLVIAFITFENLKDTFARWQRIPYHKNYFRKRSSPPKKDLAKEPKYSFEELLDLMFRDAGMHRGLKRVVKMRNRIIHSGVTRMSHDRSWAMYERCHDLLREYLLRILDFRGLYIGYAKPILKKL